MPPASRLRRDLERTSYLQFLSPYHFSVRISSVTGCYALSEDMDGTSWHDKCGPPSGAGVYGPDFGGQ